MIKGIVAGLLIAMMASPAQAADQAQDWWLVYGDTNSETARFVDLASLKTNGDASTISLLSVDRRGAAAQSTLAIDCATDKDRETARSLPAFVCGTQAYRDGNGLNIRDFPKVELARLYFQTQAAK